MLVPPVGSTQRSQTGYKIVQKMENVYKKWKVYTGTKKHVLPFGIQTD
jgi:hypothetical protein